MKWGIIRLRMRGCCEGSLESGVGGRESGVGSRESGVGSQSVFEGH